MSLKKILLFAISGFVMVRLVIWGRIGSCTALAPDEDRYFLAFKYVNNSSLDRPTVVWSNTPDWLLSIFFAPGRLFMAVGVPEFQAFRLQSITLALGALLIVLASLKNLGFNKRFTGLDRKNKVLILTFLIIASLMPSNIIWSILGLREPFIYISLALIFFSFSDFINSNRLFSSSIISYFVGLVILGFTKFYLYIIICFSISLTLIILAKTYNFRKLLTVFLITMTTLPLFSTQFEEVNWPTISFSNIKLTLDYLPDFSSPKLPSMTYSQLVACRDSNKSGPLLIRSLQIVESLLPQRVEVATSQLPVDEPSATALRNDENLRGELNLFNLPIGLFSFLFFPFSILDSGLFGLLGIFEVVFWAPLYWMLTVQVWRSRKSIKSDPMAVASLTFILLFSFFSALTEVNFGTALRHRSVLLVPMVLVALVIWQNKPTKPPHPKVGNHHPFS